MIKVLGSGKIRFSFDTGQVCDVIFSDTMATVFHGTNVYKMGADSLAEFLYRKSMEHATTENQQPVQSKKKRGRPKKNP